MVKPPNVSGRPGQEIAPDALAVPQFILDSLIEDQRGSQAHLVVTQPRRIAAVSVAARVSAERAIDGSVGYIIRGENQLGPKTKLIFCTTGVVLRQLASQDKLSKVSHLIIDEVCSCTKAREARVKLPTISRFMSDRSKVTSFFWKLENC